MKSNVLNIASGKKIKGKIKKKLFKGKFKPILLKYFLLLKIYPADL